MEREEKTTLINHLCMTKELEQFRQNAFTNMEYFLEEGDLVEALNWLRRLKDCDKNTGYGIARLNYDMNDLENAFHREWIKENLPEPGVNSGHGLLHTILNNYNIEVTDKDRKVAATVIQWLGTNCGRSFLEQSLKRCGAKIIY